MTEYERIDNFISNNENIDIIAKEIVEILETEDLKEDNIKSEFNIVSGSMVDKDSPNTSFFVDLKDKSRKIYELKKILFGDSDISDSDNIDSVDISELSKNTDIDNQLEERISSFFKSVCNAILITYRDRLRNIIRKNIIPDSDVDMVPLKNISIVDLCILDLDSYSENSTSILQVNKLVRKDSVTNSDSGVSAELIQISNSTGENVDDIIARKRIEDPERYSGVVSAIWKKYLFELSIELCVDYSPEEPLVLVEKLFERSVKKDSIISKLEAKIAKYQKDIKSLTEDSIEDYDLD